jgi:isopentenyl-diphosphate delta-isomerase
MATQVILVDSNDVQIGVSEKQEAHVNGGRLHRSFSVLLFDEENRLLIHQRSASKYHTPHLWTNTCCSHPMPGESVEAAVHRRLVEELSNDFSCEEVFCMTYRAELEGGMVEHEFDHIFLGKTNEPERVIPNPQEIQEIQWIEIELVRKEIDIRPEKFTPWFIILMTVHLKKITDWIDASKKSTKF